MDKYTIFWIPQHNDEVKAALIAGDITEVKINERKQTAKFYQDDGLVAWFTEVVAVVKVKVDEASSAE